MVKPKNVPKKNTNEIQSSWMDIGQSIDNLRKDMEQIFSSFPSSILMQKIPDSSCDVIDEGSQFRVKMDIPGVKKNEISLNVTGNSLEISAKHKEESKEKKKNYLRKERNQISYYKTLSMPEEVISGKVNAKLTDGVLDITLPKSKPTKTQEKKSIQIQ